jgi:hypothetical protein
VVLSLLYSQVKTELLLYLVQHRLFIQSREGRKIR